MKSGEDCVQDENRKPPIIQYFAALAGTLNVVCSGMHYGWASVSLPQFLHGNSKVTMTDDDGSWIAVMVLIGAVCGSLIAGAILDRLGRKRTILLASIPFFISWILIAFLQSVNLLIFSRFLAGISDGLIFCSVPMYLGEISDPKIRGFTGSTFMVSFIFGMLIINLIGSFLSITVTALISSVLPVIVLAIFSWMPESPYYLILKEDLKQAKRSLERLKGTEKVEQELNRLVRAVEEQKLENQRYSDLFRVKSNRKALFAVLSARGTQQFCGATAILFYVEAIFTEVGGSVSPTVSTIAYFSIQLIISGFSSAIVDRTGRKPLIIISNIGMIAVLLIEGGYFFMKNTMHVDTSSFAFLSVIGFIVYIIVYNIGMQTIPLLLVGEVFPTNVKAFAVCLTDIYECSLAVLLSKFFQFTKDGYGLHVPLFAFAIFTTAGLVLIICYVPETKGKTLEQIQEEFKDNRKSEKGLKDLVPLKQINIDSRP